MDQRDEQILNLLQGNARLSYQELGDALGISRVAAKKRVQKLEQDGIIRAYNTCIYRPEEITLLMDIVAQPGRVDDILRYITGRTAYIRQIYRTTQKNHLHIVAVGPSVAELKYLIKMIEKNCGDCIESLTHHGVTEVVKDVYGKILP